MPNTVLTRRLNIDVPSVLVSLRIAVALPSTETRLCTCKIQYTSHIFVDEYTRGKAVYKQLQQFSRIGCSAQGSSSSV